MSATQITECKSFSIPEYYREKDVFLTGVTGFLGKVILEKLLRTCPEVRRCYVLIRPKRDKNPAERINEVLNCQLFKRLRHEQPEVENKILPISGNIKEPMFAMSLEDQARVCRTTVVVFNTAATIKFEEEIKEAVRTNLSSVGHLIDLCRQMPLLEACVHVSTAYSNCNVKHVLECVYQLSVNPRNLMNTVSVLDKECVDLVKDKLLQDRPNTYTYTKAMAEYLIQQEAETLPFAIIRPSCVGATCADPFPGWVDSATAATAFMIGCANGLLRIMKADENANADVIPVDMVSHSVIAIAAFTAKNRPKELKVFNCTSGHLRRITWGEMIRTTVEHFRRHPSKYTFRYPSCSITLSETSLAVGVLFKQLIPAVLMDLGLRLKGQRPKFLLATKRLQRMSRTVHFFSCNEWEFSYDNLASVWKEMSSQDRQNFLINPDIIDWEDYMESYCEGVKKFIFHEDVSESQRDRSTTIRLSQLLKPLQIIGILTIIAGILFNKSAFFSVWSMCKEGIFQVTNSMISMK